MSVTGTGAGSLSFSGSGTGASHPAATGAGSLSFSGSGTAYAYAAGSGDGSLSFAGAGVGASHPAGVGAGSLSFSGAGSGVGHVSATGAGSLSFTGAATGGPVVTGVGAGSLSFVGDGGDTPRGVGAGSLSFSGAGSGWVGTAADGLWLYLHTTPPAQIYQIDALRGRMDAALPQMRIPFSVSATQAQLGQQNEAFSVALDKPSATLRARLATQGPHGVRVDVMDGGTLSRTGIIAGVRGGPDGIDIDCEGGIWSRDLPLRTNADMGQFRDVAVLPWRFGRAVPGKLVRLNAAGTLWLWSDHASSTIRSLTADGQPYDAWQWRNTIDASGHAYTLIQTAEAFDVFADLVAVGDGALDPLSGTLITNPADVVYALCVGAGMSIDRGAMVPFRVECLAAGLEVSGSIDGGTLQGACTGIADSIYAAFGRSLPGLMRLRPRTGAQAAIPARDTPVGDAVRDGIVTRLRVRYALEDGKPRGTVEVRAPGVEALHGSTVSEVTLPWVRDERVAAEVAGRMLADRARPRYAVQAARQVRRWVPGDLATVTVSALGLSGEALVVASTIDDDGSAPRFELPVGDSPSTEILSSAVAYEPEVYVGAGVVTQGTDRIIGPITDTSGRPIAGATCVLDGSVTRTTDSAGKVAFTLAQMPPGTHVIDITASGMQPQQITVTV